MLQPLHFKDEETRPAATRRAEAKSSNSKFNILRNSVVTSKTRKEGTRVTVILKEELAGPNE